MAFGSNRVAKIQSYVLNFPLKCISSVSNRTDPVSRDLDITELPGNHCGALDLAFARNSLVFLTIKLLSYHQRITVLLYLLATPVNDDL